MKFSKQFFCMIFAGIFSTAQAATHYYFQPASGNWNVATNWDLGAMPTGDAYAHIESSKIATISSTVDQINRAQIGTTSGTGTLNVVTGGWINTVGSTEVGRMAVVNSVGYMNVSGGYYRSGATAGSQYLKVGVDAAGKLATGILTISGGTVESKLMIGSAGIAGATADKMRIEGNTATIFSTQSTSSGSGLIVGDSGTVEFVFNSAGISGLTFNAADASFSTGSQIIVDGTAYTGGAQTFTLIDATTFTNGTPTITVTNFGAGTTYNWDAANGNFTVTAAPRQIKSLSLVYIGTP